MCRTDAAVGPVGVVVVLRHAGVAEEAVARPHRLLGLQTKSTCVTAVTPFALMGRGRTSA